MLTIIDFCAKRCGMSFSAASFFSRKKIALTLLLLAGTLVAAAAPLRYSGSDFFAGEPEKALNAEIAEATGAQPESRLRGSISGEKELRLGEADFALLILPGSGKTHPLVKKGEWRVIPLAYQVAYVAVASANPADEISFEALASVFGSFSKKSAEKWEDIGVSGFSSALLPYVGDVSRTDAVTFFQRKVLPKYTLRPNVRSAVSDDLAFKEIVNNPGAIAIVGSPVPAGLPVKTLAVADTHGNANATPYSPSFTNIYNGDYPLTIPFCVVYPAKNRLTLKPVLSFLYSDVMAKRLAEAGFLPLEAKVRKQFQKGIDNIK